MLWRAGGNRLKSAQVRILPELRWEQCRSRRAWEGGSLRLLLSSGTVVVAAGFDDCRGVILRVSMPPGAAQQV